MGTLLSYLRYGDESIVDPLTNLTKKDKRLIKSLGPALTNKLGAAGPDLLYVFFQKHPGYQKYFPFRDVPADQLKTNMLFLVHCTSVLGVVASWIDNLDNPELLLAIFNKVGMNHKRHNLPKQSFLDLLEVLVGGLQPLMDKETHDAYGKLLNLAVKSAISAAE